MNILNFVLDTDNKKNAFICQERVYTYFDINEIYLKNIDLISSLKNSCVVINSRKRVEIALLLCILDGNVKRILFLPNDINKALKIKYLQEAKINYEVHLEDEILKINEIRSEQIDENILETEWIIPTSGTTNNPKLVIHTLKSLIKTAKINKEIGQSYIWGLTFDIYRFSGIQVFLQSILGSSCIIIPEQQDSITNIIELFIKYECNIISATPSFWRKLLMIEKTKQINLKRATLGGEISDETILLAIKHKFRNIKITHIYASTEVGVGFAVTDGKAGFPLDYIEKGFNEIKLKIDQNSLLWINSGKKNQKYIDSQIPDDDGYINTGDKVEIRNDRVYFLGRESGSINVGGNKVIPEEVEIKLLKSTLIQQAYVYSKKSSIIGNLVYADVIPFDLNKDHQELKKELLNYCRNNMESFKIPVNIRILNELQINENGKIRRK